MKNNQLSTILFVTGSLERGGAERQMYYLANNIQKSGRKVFVATLDHDAFYQTKLQALNIPVFNFESDNKLKRFGILRKYVKSIKPDLIYSFHFYTNIYSWYAAKFVGALSFGSIRNDGYFEKRMTGKLSYLHFYLPHLVVGNSLHGIKNASKAFPVSRKMNYLNNVIDRENFPFKFYESEKKKPIQLLYIGRFEPQKRLDRLISFVEKLVELGNNVHLNMIGRGSLKDQITGLIQQKGLNNRIEIHKESKNVHEWMSRSHWLVISSDFEGTPNVVLESMCSGLPVIAHCFEGIEYLLEDGKGRIVDMDSEFSLPDLVDNEIRLKIAKRAAVAIEESFSLPSQLKNFDDLC